MNQGHPLKDPAAGVPRELLPHLHLLSKHRYPVTTNPSLETLVGYLLEAPKIVREGQPVQWQWLECPQDGTIFLTWQPPDLGINFASDGYIWADQETPFNSDVRGYTLQMFMHKAGFRPNVDQVAGHCRRRYRLLPPQQSTGAPMPDPSLWLIHYTKSTPRDHIPINQIPISPQVHAQMQQRRAIASAGAIARREFMLHDRNNWPTIQIPGAIARHGPGGPVGPVAHRRGQSLAGGESTVEEEEDVSRGDALDFMTPRDISRMRYEQHHEWMEEILESPYRTNQIVPPDLGLGRKGELEAFTKGFFYAPTSAAQEPTASGDVSRVGKLDVGKAEEFTKLAHQKLADMQAELEKMKHSHQKRMEQFKKGSALIGAEKRLRSAVFDVEHRKSVANGPANSEESASDPVDEIVKEVEKAVGKKIDPTKNVTCIAKGGYQEAQQNFASNNEANQNTPMATKQPSNLPASTAQQQRSQPAQTSLPSPSQAGPNVSQPNGAGSQPSQSTAPPQPQSNDQSSDEPLNTEITPGEPELADVEMTEMDGQQEGDDILLDTNDWVMVDDSAGAADLDTPSFGNMVKSTEDGQTSEQTPIGTGFTPGVSADPTPQPLPDQQQEITPQNTEQQQDQQDPQQQQQQQPPQEQPSGETPLDPADFDFDDPNTAGDALADYGADGDLDLDTMDDSAFGDAFHHTDDNAL